MDAYTIVRMNWLLPDTVCEPSCRRPGDRGTAGCAETTRQAPTRTVERHTTGRDVFLGEKCTTTSPECSNRRWRALANRTMNGPTGALRTNGSRTPFPMNLPNRYFVLLRFTPERFRVHLNFLFQVLSNCPSRYVFARRARPRCGLICPSVYVLLTYNLQHIFT